ncbi:AAA family ATPase [Leucobacter sp. HNU]|uniref:ATP-binding protein n=1 Tax=Leucobacter sp. HNU TaxID=3236805 RepID=UPI003A80B26F
MLPAPAAIPHPALDPADHPGAVLEAARRARSALVAVTGLAGVGKSTWVRQLLAAGEGRARIVATAADAFEQSFPFALADKVARAAGVREGLLDAPTALDLLSAGRLLLPALTRGVSSVRPLCVVVDNAQWIDDASAGVLRFVLGRVAHGGLLVVLSGHAPRVTALAESIAEADPTAWGEVRALALDPLDAAGVREYASRVHGREISLRLSDRIRDLSGGLPVHIDALVAGMERTAPDRSHWDEDVQFPIVPENPFHGVGTGDTEAVASAVEISSVLRGSLDRHELLGVASRLGEPADIAGALGEGLLVAAGDRGIAPFHDLYAADVATRIDPARRRAVLVAAADTLSSAHRALDCRLDAAEELDPLLLAEVRTTAAGAVSEGQPDRAIEYLRRASALAGPRLRDELVVEICILAAAELVSPSVLDLLPELERMPSSPLRDLALLQTKQITGDIPWAAGFAAELLAAPIDHPDARTLELHTAMLAVMIQLTTGDYGPLPALLDRTRGLADALAERPEPVTDRRLSPSPRQRRSDSARPRCWCSPPTAWGSANAPRRNSSHSAHASTQPSTPPRSPTRSSAVPGTSAGSAGSRRPPPTSNAWPGCATPGSPGGASATRGCSRRTAPGCSAAPPRRPNVSRRRSRPCSTASTSRPGRSPISCAPCCTPPPATPRGTSATSARPPR